MYFPTSATLTTGRSFRTCIHQRLPFRPIGFAAGFQAQAFHQQFRHAGFFEQQRYFVDIIGSRHGNDRLLFHIAEQGDLFDQRGIHREIRAGHDHVGRDPHGAQFAHGVLGGFGLQLGGCADMRQPGHMHTGRVLAAQVAAHLADGFDEGLAFDVADRSTHLDQHHLGAGRLGHALDAAFDLVGDMGNDLDRATQVIAVAFARDHLGVHLPGGHIAFAVEANINEAFIMPQVQVGLRAIIQNIHLAVLVGRHGTGIDIDIRVEFLDGDLQPALLQELPDGCGGDAFADRTDHPAGKIDITCRWFFLWHVSLSG